MKVKQTINVNYKVVEMIEVFCPTCGHKMHLYKDNAIYDYEDEFFCDKCNQELAIDINNLLEEEDI